MLIENFRPGTMEAWGLGYEALAAVNPGLVMLRISGYGQTGPYRDRPGFGVVGEAMGGLRQLTGEPGRITVRVGVSIGDTLSALHGTIGVLAALHERNRNGGRGQVVDVALYEAVFNCMESLLPEYSAFGAVREAAGSALPGIAPSPWVMFALAFGGTSIAMLLYQNGLAWDIPATATVFIILTLDVAGLAYIFTSARRAGWTNMHRLALAAGALLTYCWSGFVFLLALHGPATIPSHAGLVAVFIAGLALLRWKLHLNEDGESPRELRRLHYLIEWRRPSGTE